LLLLKKGQFDTTYYSKKGKCKKMKIEIMPEHFGLTIGKRLLLIAPVIICAGLSPALSKWIACMLWPGSARASLPWYGTEQDIIQNAYFLPFVAFWLFWKFWYSSDLNYSLELTDNDIRIGNRVVRKGYVRYLREFNCVFWKSRLELSEREPRAIWFHGPTVIIPKGLPEYEQIKAQVTTWMVNSMPPTIE
jgi:hypothetical protein